MHLVESSNRRPSINITSLIDVLFLLLTFFLITTNFIEQAAVKIELPSMKNSERVIQEEEFVLNVNSNGQMTYNGESVSKATLVSDLTKKSKEINAGGGLVLRADRVLSHGKVMNVLDLIRGAGIRRFMIATIDE